MDEAKETLRLDLPDSNHTVCLVFIFRAVPGQDQNKKIKGEDRKTHRRFELALRKQCAEVDAGDGGLPTRWKKGSVELDEGVFRLLKKYVELHDDAGVPSEMSVAFEDIKEWVEAESDRMDREKREREKKEKEERDAKEKAGKT